MTIEDIEPLGVLIARLMEDDLTTKIETGLFIACARIVREPALREIERRIAEEEATNVRTFIRIRLEQSAVWLRSLA